MDIWDTADSFYFVYTQVAAATGRVTARVVSMENTAPWSKAGVMIRDSLESNSLNAAVVMCPGRVSLQWRSKDVNDSTEEIAVTDVNYPHWVRVTYGQIDGDYFIIGEHANDVNAALNKWSEIDTVDIITHTPASPIFLGLCVSSQSYGNKCTADFSNVALLKTFPPGTAVPDPTVGQDIGVPYNEPEPMYVALEDNNSKGTVYHPDPNATQTGKWTEWRIDLNDFRVQDVNLTDVRKIRIGVGDGINGPDGTGKVHIDDIRLYRPEFYPPECPQRPGDIVYDGMVDYNDLDVMAEEWLTSGIEADLIDDDIVNFKDFAELAEDWGEQQLWPAW
jgi:hypothetical protein